MQSIELFLQFHVVIIYFKYFGIKTLKKDLCTMVYWNITGSDTVILKMGPSNCKDTQRKFITGFINLLMRKYKLKLK